MKEIFKYLVGGAIVVVVVGASSQDGNRGRFEIISGKSGLTYSMEEESRIIKLDTQTGDTWVYFETKDPPSFRWARIINAGSQ